MIFYSGFLFYNILCWKWKFNSFCSKLSI